MGKCAVSCVLFLWQCLGKKQLALQSWSKLRDTLKEALKEGNEQSSGISLVGLRGGDTSLQQSTEPMQM